MAEVVVRPLGEQAVGVDVLAGGEGEWEEGYDEGIETPGTE